MASRHQAAASPMAPAPSDTVPIVVPDSLLWWMSRARTGRAVTHIEAPRNNIASMAEVRAGKSWV